MAGDCRHCPGSHLPAGTVPAAGIRSEGSSGLPVPAEPAHVIALRELTRLKEEELWQKGEMKEYYSRLSDILRRYIDNRYGISSPELTTDETVRMLQKAAVTTHGQMTLVKELLSLSDMVKFAKYLPRASMHEKSS